MLTKTLAPAVLALAMLGGLEPAFAVTATLPSASAAQPGLTAAEKAQLAEEAGISPAQAKTMTLNQLAMMKYHRDGDDGPYVEISPSHS